MCEPSCSAPQYSALRGSWGNAAQILVQLTGDDDPKIDPIETARARWLLAATSRELHQPARAAELLDQAWNTVAGHDVYHLNLVLECLLERAVQVTETDPIQALHLLGLVTAHRGRFALLDGVTYDDRALLTDLQRRLGADLVRRTLNLAASHSLPSAPIWPSTPSRSST